MMVQLKCQTTIFWPWQSKYADHMALRTFRVHRVTLPKPRLLTSKRTEVNRIPVDLKLNKKPLETISFAALVQYSSISS